MNTIKKMKNHVHDHSHKFHEKTPEKPKKNIFLSTQKLSNFLNNIVKKTDFSHEKLISFRRKIIMKIKGKKTNSFAIHFLHTY